MSAHNYHATHDMAMDKFPIKDPGDTGTIKSGRSGICQLVTGTGETRTLGVPSAKGVVIDLVMKTDTGDCTVTVTSGFDARGTTTLVFDDVGDFVRLVAVPISATAFRWRLIAADGVETPESPISAITLDDTSTLTFGTGSDVEMQWDGISLIVAPPTGMWSNCPLVQYADGFKQAYEFYDDFLSFSLGDLTSVWTLDGAGGTAVLGAAETSNTPGPGGYITLAASTTDEDWVTVKNTTTETGAPWKISASGKAMWFETSFIPSSTTTCSYMVGLISPADTEPIADTTGGENSITDGIYWHTVGGTSTTTLLFSHNDGTEVDVDTTAGTLAANTEIVLGFYFDGTTLTPYVNGTAGDTVLASATNFPNAAGMTPFFACKTHASSNAINMHVDYVKCVQLR